MTEQNKFAPGPPGFFPTGKYSKIFKNDPMELFMRINNDFGPIASFSIFGIRVTSITNPVDVKYVISVCESAVLWIFARRMGDLV
jgi:hypothetical protein